jgi:hypothetical protein
MNVPNTQSSAPWVYFSNHIVFAIRSQVMNGGMSTSLRVRHALFHSFYRDSCQ